MKKGCHGPQNRDCSSFWCPLRPEVTSEAVMATKMVVGVNMHEVFQVVDFKSEVKFDMQGH